jgi:hypothetical protein
MIANFHGAWVSAALMITESRGRPAAGPIAG